MTTTIPAKVSQNHLGRGYHGGMRDLDRTLRLIIYEHFGRTGSTPSLETIATRGQCSRPEVETSLARLEAEHHALALAPTTRNVWMAHPFSAVPSPFPVETASVTYWGNCAWDAVAIPSLLSLDASVPARCAESGAEMNLAFRNGSIVDNTAPNGVVHFVVPPRRFWDNIGYT